MTVERCLAAEFEAAQADLIALLQDAVGGGASVNFVAPLRFEIAAAYWSDVGREVAAGRRIVLVTRQAGRIVGTIQLVLAMQLNGLHRAEVQKLLVHREYRRQGIAKALLAAIELEALAIGRHLLVLDTERGSVAERLYAECGYSRAGVIPAYALNGDGSALIDTVLFYRQLLHDHLTSLP